MAAPSSREPRPQAAGSPCFLRSPCCPGPLHGVLSATSEQASRELPPPPGPSRASCSLTASGRRPASRGPCSRWPCRLLHAGRSEAPKLLVLPGGPPLHVAPPQALHSWTRKGPFLAQSPAPHRARCALRGGSRGRGSSLLRLSLRVASWSPLVSGVQGEGRWPRSLP